MKHSKDQEYLATIKRNHKVVSHFENINGVGTNYYKTRIDKMLQHLKSLRYIRRLSGIPLIQNYNVAIHCYYTGILFEAIADYEKISINKSEIDFVYRHDIVESITGDVLLPVKLHSKNTGKKWKEIEIELIENKYPYLEFYVDANAQKYFNPISWNLFKACDLFELYLFCLEEIKLGNKHDGILSVHTNCINLLRTFKINYITERL